MGIIDLLRSDDVRLFAEHASGTKLVPDPGCQVICYKPGDFSGPHNDHHPEEDHLKHGYVDLHIMLAEVGVASQLLIYEKSAGLLNAVEEVGQGVGVAVYRLPFWHYTTPLIPREVLTDRDPAFVIGATSDGRPIFAPDWVDQCFSLGVHPKACKPYRAKTKGKVERMIREVKEDFLCWLTGQGMPPRPTLFDYEELGRRWAIEVVGARTHRTTGRVVREAWCEEVELLRPIPERLLVQSEGVEVITNIIDLAAIKAAGAQVAHRGLEHYQQVLR